MAKNKSILLRVPVKGFYKCNYCNPDAVEKVLRCISNLLTVQQSQ